MTLEDQSQDGKSLKAVIGRSADWSEIAKDCVYFAKGSGFDLMYDRLLSQGRPAPLSEEGPDWVKVTIQHRPHQRHEVFRRARRPSRFGFPDQDQFGANRAASARRFGLGGPAPLPGFGGW